MKKISLFDALRCPVDKMGKAKRGKAAQLFFQIKATEQGCFLKVVDRQGHEVEADYCVAWGAQRELLKALEAVRTLTDGTVAWEKDEEQGVPLAEHSHLLWLLARCEGVVDGAMEPLAFSEELREVELQLDPQAEAGWIRGKMVLRSGDLPAVLLKRPIMISETHLLFDQKVYLVKPLGPAFRTLPLFEDVLPETRLNECLTLVFSSFSNVQMAYRGYVVKTDDPIQARPALVFQQVDEHTALHLVISLVLPGLPLEFVRDYDIGRVAFVDDLEQVIRVREVEYGDMLEARADLLKRVQKLSRALKSPEAYLIDDDEGLVLGPALAAEFLHGHLAELIHQFELFGSEKLTQYKIKYTQPKLSVSLGHGIDFLEGSATLEMEGERFSLFEVLQQYRKQSYVALADGSHAVLNAGYMAKLSRLFKKQKEGVRISFFDLPLIESLMEDNAERAALPKSREIFNGFNTLTSRPLQVARFAGTLRPYQADGVKWLDYLYEHRLGGCLADDMGLGKTIQAIALLSRIYPEEKKASLIVMPKSLLFNWRRELTTFSPSLNVYTYYAGERNLEELQRHQVILTTYGTLRSDIEALSAVSFHAVILDESQAIKNLTTQTAKAALALNCSFRLALSGTPIENNLAELYTLFRFLNPTMFGSSGEFERDYVQPIQRTGDKEAAQELRRKIYPFILRRLKGDVLKELPPKVEQVLYAEMGDEQKSFYEARRRFYQELIRGEIERKGLAQSRFVVLEALLELRQLATVPESKSDGLIVSAKRELLMETLKEAVMNNRKCLVFTNFLAGVEQVSEALNEAAIEHLTMTGSTSNRQQLVERFQNDPRLKVFVMTLKTGGVGLNLTAADTVFVLDPWWNTSAEAQAIDRTHRIGQSKTVFTYRLIAKDTIEEKIMALQQRKRELVDQIVSSDGAALKVLTEADIEHLLGE
jgi:superfamily II DNA or RNA helicase